MARLKCLWGLQFSLVWLPRHRRPGCSFSYVRSSQSSEVHDVGLGSEPSNWIPYPSQLMIFMNSAFQRIIRRRFLLSALFSSPSIAFALEVEFDMSRMSTVKPGFGRHPHSHVYCSRPSQVVSFIHRNCEVNSCDDTMSSCCTPFPREWRGSGWAVVLLPAHQPANIFT